MRSPPLKLTLPSTIVPAPIRLSMRFCGGVCFFRSNMGSSLGDHKRPAGTGACLSGLEGACGDRSHLGAGRYPDGPFKPLIILEFELECRCQLGLLVGQRHDGGPRRDPAGGRRLDRRLQCKRALEFIPRGPAPHYEYAVMPGVIALALDRKSLNRKPGLLVGVGDEFLQERKLLLELGVLGHELERLLRQRGLRACRHAELAFELRVAGAKRGRLGAHFFVFGFERGDLGQDLLAVEAAEDLPEVETPPPHAGNDRQKPEHDDYPPRPGKTRPPRHPRRIDPEVPEELARAAPRGRERHDYGRTGAAVRPVVSGSPNMRFMFCTAWPAAPLTRLSCTARIT